MKECLFLQIFCESLEHLIRHLTYTYDDDTLSTEVHFTAWNYLAASI